MDIIIFILDILYLERDEEITVTTNSIQQFHVLDEL